MNSQSFLWLIVPVLIVGVALYLIPVEEKYKKVIYVIVVLWVVMWILNYFGVTNFRG